MKPRQNKSTTQLLQHLKSDFKGTIGCTIKSIKIDTKVIFRLFN